jgi:hydroxymethylpyrimidine/phosphomethylpyrimidine kinase
MRTALTIAGSDPTGGAGLQADLLTFAAGGVHGLSVVTAITVQTTRELLQVVPLGPSVVVAQLQAVIDDLGADAVKIGMLATGAIAAAVADAIERRRLPNVVVDPVMHASVGGALIDVDGVRMLVERLLPLATLVTPNVAEAEALTGLRIRGTGDLAAAARRLVDLGARAAVVKGGHAPGAPGDVVDVLFDGHTITELHGERIADRHTHGTGCAFSAAVAARLARGDDVVSAARAAKTYVAEAIRHATRTSSGRDLLGHAVRSRS